MTRHQLTTAIALGLVALSGAGASRSGVSLSIISCWAQRSERFIMHTESGDIVTNDVEVSCTAVIDNQSDAPLTVTSLFFSAYDGLEVSLFDASGRQVALQSYLLHQSPSSFAGQQFTLAVGRTTNELHFPILGVSETNTTLGVRLDGTLPGSSYSGSLTSNIVNVKVKKWRAR